MTIEQSTWEAWAKFFVNRSKRSLPALEQDCDYSELPPSLARSLAIFQLGESGGGTIVKQALHNNLQGVDEYYAAAVALFVEEEHRHANILAMCVRLLNGTFVCIRATIDRFTIKGHCSTGRGSGRYLLLPSAGGSSAAISS